MQFDNEKVTCLKRKDNSNKGSIDPDIRNLVDLINSLEDYYTTSSCSGRIVIIELIEKKKDTKFIFVEHNKAKFNSIKSSLKTMRLNQVDGGGREDGNIESKEANPKTKNNLWFKQESLILHVCCRDLKSAEELLSIVRNSGIKRAGIISLRNRIIIEIIGTEHMETLIAKDGNLLVDDKFLKVLIAEANKKLERNKRNVDKLYLELKKKFEYPSSGFTT
ncbi:MAG: hypothetical protein KKC75_04270 [Nanoarchaeota archaeon]|nr:hypothetical protein [Nanoarchaeota archaeon]MBU1005372.1 hypothetical protein [Nanoarchaeota archaeon]MBU1946072.1 hypothetical protein [Nanoarchaeota archaeon]